MKIKIKRRWDIESMRCELDTSNSFVEKFLVRLYKNQSSLEQNQKYTRHINGKGFSVYHARLGSYLACIILNGDHLSQDQICKARYIVKRYCRQILKLMSDIENPIINRNMLKYVKIYPGEVIL